MLLNCNFWYLSSNFMGCPNMWEQVNAKEKTITAREGNEEEGRGKRKRRVILNYLRKKRRRRRSSGIRV